MGGVEGLFSVGEFVYVWKRIANNGACSCGARFRECPVWKPVLKGAFGGPEGVDAQAMAHVQRTSTRPRHIPLMLAPRGSELLASRWNGAYKDALLRLYRAILEITGSRVVVDSSKLPLYGYVLETMPEVELYVVQVVRGPRAVAYTWTRRKESPSAGRGLAYMPQHHPAERSLEWDLCNVASEALWG